MITVEIAEGRPHVLLVTINNPPVNALTKAMYEDLGRTFAAIAGDGEIRCAVLTATGERAFAAGSDTREHAAMDILSSLSRNRSMRQVFDAVRSCVVPIIAAVNGPALGGGLLLAACADVIVASERATFGLPEINVGVMGGAKHLSRLIPPGKARWMAFTGNRMSARDMLESGGIERVVAPGDLLRIALAMADEISGKTPAAIRIMKELLNLAEHADTGEGYHIEQLGTTLLTMLKSGDA